MNDIETFENMWKEVHTPGTMGEAYYEAMRDLAKLNPEVLAHVEQKFKEEENELKKEDLARIALSCGLKDPYIFYLKKEHGWTDEDFEE